MIYNCKDAYFSMFQAATMSKKYIAEQETKIKDSLFEFVKIHIPEADLSLIDEIVLSYVVAVLEDVGSEPVFDVEGTYIS